MNKTTNYTQCRIRKRVPEGWLETVGFLPESLANPGATIRVKDRQDRWEDGWEVAEAWETRPFEDLPDSHRQIRKHRLRSGDRDRRLESEA